MAPSTGTVLVRALAIASLFFHFLCNFTCDVSEALMLAIRVPFSSSLSKVCSCVSEALMLAMRVLLLSCLLNVSSIDSKALLRFTGLLAVMRVSLFKVKAWPHSQTDLLTCITSTYLYLSPCSTLYLQQVAKGFKIKRLSLFQARYLTMQADALRSVMNASRIYIHLPLNRQLMFSLLCCLHHAMPSPSIELRMQSRKAYQLETQGV